MLEALRKVSNLTNISYQNHPFGNLCRIQYPKLTVQYQSIRQDENAIIFVLHIYAEVSYIVSYVEVNKDGKVAEIWGETEGVLPRLFHAPDGTVWTCLTHLKLPKECEITIPLQGRERVQKMATSREFAGKYLGATKELSLLYNDYTSKGTDQVCKLIFDKNGLYKQRKILKIPTPGSNQAYLDAGETIHLLGHTEFPNRIHRQFDLDGNLLAERKVATTAHLIGILSLSFETTSQYISTEDNKIYYETLLPDGSIDRQLLIEIEAIKEYFYGLQPGLSMSETRTLFQFTSGVGPGWFVVEGAQLLECYLRDSSIQGFRDLLGDKHIVLGYEYIVLAAIEAFDAETYSILFHKSAQDYDFVEILTRKVGQ